MTLNATQCGFKIQLLTFIGHLLQDKDWSQVNGLLKAIPGKSSVSLSCIFVIIFIKGVVETGLFVGMTSCVYFGSPNGEISTINLP